jgi:hypothetical protein
MKGILDVIRLELFTWLVKLLIHHRIPTVLSVTANNSILMIETWNVESCADRNFFYVSQ